MPQRGLAARLGWLLRDHAKRVWDNSGEDNIFFLAGGIAFDVLFGAIPFLLMLIGVFGIVLSKVVDDPRKAVVDYIVNILPPTESVVARTYQIVDAVLQGRTSFGVIASQPSSRGLASIAPATSPTPVMARAWSRSGTRIGHGVSRPRPSAWRPVKPLLSN